MNLVRFAIVVTALTFASMAYAGQGASPDTFNDNGRTNVEPKSTPWFYFHGGVGLGTGGVKSDDYQLVIDPFRNAVAWGYSLNISVGFRNIYQFQFRPRSVAKAHFVYHLPGSSSSSTDRIDIPASIHFRNELIHKFNILFAREADERGQSLCMWLCYGVSEHGSVKHVDENGDGFWNGSETIIGVEIGMLQKYGSVTFFLERHAVTFERFGLNGLGELNMDFDAAFWFAGFQISGGLGI